MGRWNVRRALLLHSHLLSLHVLEEPWKTRKSMTGYQRIHAARSRPTRMYNRSNYTAPTRSRVNGKTHERTQDVELSPSLSAVYQHVHDLGRAGQTVGSICISSVVSVSHVSYRQINFFTIYFYASASDSCWVVHTCQESVSTVSGKQNENNFEEAKNRLSIEMLSF